jgi:hypothetical protein
MCCFVYAARRMVTIGQPAIAPHDSRKTCKTILTSIAGP